MGRELDEGKRRGRKTDLQFMAQNETLDSPLITVPPDSPDTEISSWTF